MKTKAFLPVFKFSTASDALWQPKYWIWSVPSKLIKAIQTESDVDLRSMAIWFNDDPRSILQRKNSLRSIAHAPTCSKSNHDRVSESRWLRFGVSLQLFSFKRSYGDIIPQFFNEAGLSMCKTWFSRVAYKNLSTNSYVIFIHIRQNDWTAWRDCQQFWSHAR